MRMNDTLSFNRARQLFTYNKSTGILRWKVNKARAIAGDAVGTVMQKGNYLYTRIDGVGYLVHRVVWLFYYGKWPVGQLDHKDTNRTNNRIKNLRELSQRHNSQNQRRAQRNKIASKFLGVHRDLRSKENPWTAYITVDGRGIYLGSFGNEKSAHAAYVSAKRRLHAGNTL